MNKHEMSSQTVTEVKTKVLIKEYFSGLDQLGKGLPYYDYWKDQGSLFSQASIYSLGGANFDYEGNPLGVELVDRIISDQCLRTSIKEKITSKIYSKEEVTKLRVELKEAKNVMEYDLRLAYSNEKGRTSKSFNELHKKFFTSSPERESLIKRMMDIRMILTK